MKIIFAWLNSKLSAVPLEGWRTIILGYLTTTIPALINLIENNPTGVEFYIQLVLVLAGPLINYYKVISKPRESSSV